MSSNTDEDSYKNNYGRVGELLDQIADLDGVDFKTDIDIKACYRSDDHTEFTITLLVDDEVFDNE